jgi:HK97 family phage major capsid protein/HK97 family phage prohead protease
MTIIYKDGAQSDDDPLEFVMSDETEDRIGDVIMADGWSLGDFKRNPIALYGHDSKTPIGRWKNVRIENKQLRGVLEFPKRGTSPFIDVIQSLVDQRFIKAVSVGFTPDEAEPIDGSKKFGVRYLKQKLLECSLVSVPANPNALLIAKSLSPADRARLFAKSGTSGDRVVLRTAESGVRHSHPKDKQMSLSERIRSAQDELIVLRDQVTPIAKKIEEEDELNDVEQGEFARLNTDIAALERNLDNLRSAERVLAGRPASAPASSPAAAPPASAPAAPPLLMRGHVPSRNERPMDLLIRMAVCHFESHVTRMPLDSVRQRRYGHRDDLDAVIKATTNPAQTTVAGWAAELVNTAIDDFLVTLTPVSAYAGLRARGSSFTFGQNGTIRIPRRTGSGGSAPGDLRGAFVGEGAPIPVRRANFASVSLTPHKMGVISTFTREMAAHSTPSIEALIRQGIIEDTAIAIDTALLDTQAGTAVRPAGLLNGVTPLTATTGGGLTAVTGDISKLMTPFVQANAATGLVLLANPADMVRLSVLTNALGQFVFQDQIAGGTLMGNPLITSTVVTAGTIIMIRVTDFATGTGDTPEWDISDVATIHEDDGTYAADQTVTQPTATVKPIVSSGPTPAAPVRSLWQTATIGIRMLLDMDWAMRRASMVSVINNVTW